MEPSGPATPAALNTYTWDTTLVADGSHSLQAKAYDDAGNVGSSATVIVTVSNAPPPDTTPPTTSITSPTNGATVSGVVNVAASASDNIGVARVEFYLDGTLKASDTSNPYTYSWDTNTVADGSHGLQARAYDAAGNMGSSAMVSVTVSNAPAPAPPAAPTNLTGTGVSTSQINLSWMDNSTNETGFNLERAPFSKGNYGTFVQIATLPANTAGYSDTGLAKGSYGYRVKATNAYGESAYSNIAKVGTKKR